MKTCLHTLFLVLILSGSHAQQKRIYIANDDHTDYFWSADDKRYREVFLNMLDYYIRKADSTIAIGLPSEQQSRFNCDGNLWLWTYEKYRSPTEVSHLINRIRSGHISVPFNALVSCYGGAPAEAVLRGMYYAGSVERRYGLDLDLAVAMENQTHPLGLASLWSGAGAKYSWKGVCGCTTEFKDSQLAERNDEVYWYTGLDGKRVLMKWYALNDTVPPGRRDKNESLGGYAEARDPLFAVTACRRKFTSPSYRNFRAAGAFGYGWDDLETYNANIFINAARQGTDNLCKVIVSNEKDFFEDIESAQGTALSSQTCTYGNEWDVLCASLAETSAKVKRSTEKLRAAEAMSTLVARFQPAFGKSLDSMRIKAWMAYGLYWEHDWTTDNVKIISSARRASWQREVEKQISDYSDALFDSAAIQLGRLIKKPRRITSHQRFFVFNPLSWERTDYADYPYEGPSAIVVRDVATKSVVPHQIYSTGGRTHLRILASRIPSIGYKIFEISPSEGINVAFNDAGQVLADNTVLQNDQFRVAINRNGVIASLVDKRNNNRECIGPSKANDLGSQLDNGVITVENRGPVSVTLKATSSDPLSHVTRITLYRDINRIDIDNQITENFTDVRKWKFDFNLNGPETWHEEVGAVIKARLTTNGGHYSTTNASYKFQTLNHFVSLSESGFGITLSNRDCYFMQLGNSTLSFLDESSNTVNVLAGGRAILPDRGIVDQDGETIFNQSFAIGTHTVFNEAAEMRFALEHQNPLVAAPVTGGTRQYPEKTFSFLAVKDPNVVVWALKPAEEGYKDRGVIARFWNFGNTASSDDVVFHTGIAEAYEASHVETDAGRNAYSKGSLKTGIPAKGINTYRVKFSSR